MSGIALALRQVRYENRAFWRNPIAAFFTFFFPLMFMIIFNVLFGGTSGLGGGLRVADFYTPGVIVLGVITATYTNIAMMVTASRDLGILKRMRGTPLPPWAFMAGRIVHAVLLALLLVVIVAAFGYLFYPERRLRSGHRPVLRAASELHQQRLRRHARLAGLDQHRLRALPDPPLRGRHAGHLESAHFGKWLRVG